MTKACPTPWKTGRFASKGDAQLAADRIRVDARGGRLDPYRCPCGKWHLATPRTLTARIRHALGGHS